MLRVELVGSTRVISLCRYYVLPRRCAPVSARVFPFKFCRRFSSMLGHAMASKHLPPELIAHTVSFLQTADTHDVCFGGRTNHLDRLRRRADSLCRDRAALAVVCREWRGILSQKAFKAATWTRALFGVARAICSSTSMRSRYICERKSLRFNRCGLRQRL